MHEPPARLGVGAVYWESLHPLFAAHPDIFQVAEVEPSTFWVRRPGPQGEVRSSPLTLDRIAALPQAKLVHGVGYPVGGMRCDQREHLAEQRRWAERLAAAWTSEHLSFNETDAGAAGFLLPPCQSDEGVAIAAGNIRRRAALLGRPFAFETGVNYLAPGPGEMDDGAFFAAVAEAADCHILLDLHNLWANERNGRARLLDVVAALPAERICELHLAGGLERRGYWLDAHSGPVPDPLMAMAAEIVPHLPALGAILFEIAPQHAAKHAPADLVRQVETLHPLWEAAGSAARYPRGDGRRAAAGRGVASVWESALVSALRAPGTASDPAIPLYRELVDSFRGGALADLMPHSLRLVQLGGGEAMLERLLADYCDDTGPCLYPADEALQFAAWLEPRMPPVAYLKEVVDLEAGIARLTSLGCDGELTFRYDPSLVVAAVAEGRCPGDLPPGDYRIVLGAGKASA